MSDPAPRCLEPSTTLLGTVEKLIPPVPPENPEKVQIAIDGANTLYREIRIENFLTYSNGDKVRLKDGRRGGNDGRSATGRDGSC
jgi:hypothetical protein